VIEQSDCFFPLTPSHRRWQRFAGYALLHPRNQAEAEHVQRCDWKTPAKSQAKFEAQEEEGEEEERRWWQAKRRVSKMVATS
jgi:hypothetical protein